MAPVNPPPVGGQTGPVPGVAVRTGVIVRTGVHMAGPFHEARLEPRLGAVAHAS
ncbi:MAG TPA: hypothetical protein VFJ94_03645 [Intrasporangium sp.]|uniref:hypothetical protein n=1 Tax=Intrasporangium sp. TaxID=1925024 RepID=UPI002D77BEC1|nr:hypothetical protein [Intrasporangium sp.]HET7397596.1 hypothetical protein [Intrasporangium sp.]